ncbi:MAG: ZIP family metal transporter [Nitrososphaerota archaeon]|nr:ZIP family metal transporter [Candidatus Bathyarchaeota archaeon]MDW8049252.1 ZIP family metal transporter [Nitrososphaerota archaeon]
MSVWLYGVSSSILVSLLSLVGILYFLISEENLKNIILYLVSFSAGGLFGDAFIHIIPELGEHSGFTPDTSIFILLGIVSSFIVEKFFQWRHCHIPTSEEHPHSFAYVNLFGDSVHNFIDGLIIGGSYMMGTSVGVATTLAVMFHEIPQEMGDFGVLIYGGFTKKKAVMFNLLTAFTALIGTIAALMMGTMINSFTSYLMPFAAGSFIYIAGSDLIPEIRKEEPNLLKSTTQLLSLTLGILVIFSLSFLE